MTNPKSTKPLGLKEVLVLGVKFLAALIFLPLVALWYAIGRGLMRVCKWLGQFEEH